VSPDRSGEGGHFCSGCDTKTAIVRVSYTVNGNLYTGVPVRVCINPDCVTKMGATVVPAKHLSRPRAY
jgi:hypothetical protein